MQSKAVSDTSSTASASSSTTGATSSSSPQDLHEREGSSLIEISSPQLFFILFFFDVGFLNVVYKFY